MLYSLLLFGERQFLSTKKRGGLFVGTPRCKGKRYAACYGIGKAKMRAVFVHGDSFFRPAPHYRALLLY